MPYLLTIVLYTLNTHLSSVSVYFLHILKAPHFSQDANKEILMNRTSTALIGEGGLEPPTTRLIRLPLCQLSYFPKQAAKHTPDGPKKGRRKWSSAFDLHYYYKWELWELWESFKNPVIIFPTILRSICIFLPIFSSFNPSKYRSWKILRVLLS